jgi:hypothetical protein
VRSTSRRTLLAMREPNQQEERSARHVSTRPLVVQRERCPRFRGDTSSSGPSDARRPASPRAGAGKPPRQRAATRRRHGRGASGTPWWDRRAARERQRTRIPSRVPGNRLRAIHPGRPRPNHRGRGARSIDRAEHRARTRRRGPCHQPRQRRGGRVDLPARDGRPRANARTACAIRAEFSGVRRPGDSSTTKAALDDSEVSCPARIVLLLSGGCDTLGGWSGR